MTKYFITIPKEDLPKISHLSLENIGVIDDTISFQTSKQVYQKLLGLNIDFKYTKSNFVVSMFKKHLIIIIGLMVIAILITAQSMSIRKIEFTNYDTYDQEVYNYLHTKLKKVGPFYYLDDSLKNINQTLRKDFYQYEWIGIRKSASVLYVDIKKLDEQPLILKNEKIGDLVAKSDAFIDSYKVEQGIVMVERNQTVSAGEVLISGNLQIKNGGTEYVAPRGIVLGVTLEYHYQEIPKTETNLINTGKVEYDQKIIFFNQEFNNESSYESFRTEFDIIWELGNILKVVRIYNYQIKEVTTSYTLDDAIKYGASKIYQQFIEKRIDEDEEFIYCNYISHQETENSYLIKYLVKEKINIAILNEVFAE